MGQHSLALQAWFRGREGQGVDPGRLLRQWREGLAGCLPAWLRRRLDPALSPLVLEPGADGVTHLYRRAGDERRAVGDISRTDPGAVQRLRSLHKDPRQPVILRLPEGWVLRRRVTLPAAARENLRQVIGFEMDRLTPFTVDQVFYEYRPVTAPADPGQLTVELAVVPRERVEPWLALLREAGLRVSLIEAEGLWPEANLLPPEARSRISGRDLMTRAVLLLLLLVLLVTALGIPLWQRASRVAALEEEVAVARRQADVVLRLRERLDKRQESLDYVLSRRRESLPVVTVLKRVTELLPDDTWLQQFDLRGNELSLRGMSDQATALIRRLEESPAFFSVGFRSPVVQAGEKERFYLSAKVVSPGEKP